MQTLKHQLRALIQSTEAGLLERDVAVRLTLLAALAGEHVLLIGPPGTAKSELARRIQHAFDGARYFERLLTRFSVPEELFGPLSLKALEDDRYERLTDGYLPTASVAFLDEVFKANSAILNALLTLLNERTFDNGAGRTRTPLICVVGATNEVPDDEALQAFYDRFLLRIPVGVVGDASFHALLSLPQDTKPNPTKTLTIATQQALKAKREGVALSQPVLDALDALRAHTNTLGIQVSDRRWRQLAQLLRLQAASLDQGNVALLDLWLLPYAVAQKPEQLAPLQAWFIDHVLQTPPPDAPWLTRAVEAFEKQLDIEHQLQQEDGDAGKIALARAIADTDEGGMPRLLNATLEAKLRKRFSPLHVQARVAQVDEVLSPLLAPLQSLRDHAARMQAACDEHLWLPPSLKAQILARHQAAVQSLATLVSRLQATRAGFAAQPIDPALSQDPTLAAPARIPLPDPIEHQAAAA
jgi:MoxR-like ATPase